MECHGTVGPTGMLLSSWPVALRKCRRGEGREYPVEQPRNPQPKLGKRENQG